MLRRLVSVLLLCCVSFRAELLYSPKAYLLLTFTINVVLQFLCCIGLYKYMLQPQKGSNPFCIAVLIKRESTAEQRVRASWLVSGLVIFGIDNCSLVSNKKEDSLQCKVCSWTAEACVLWLPMPTVFEGKWVCGWRRILANIHLVGSWLWGRTVGILLGFVC